ncbi:S9 family peptidase [Acidicapsa dinghuensis]|uniref:S9 family peptidase n=1 Tax=Acidicapsa dinghuensis TaxID=2218256 RepID=A0ABW1EDQ1_9BACT|nr:S9 family peptidase [Acidicapsa dinghuensis]
MIISWVKSGFYNAFLLFVGYVLLLDGPLCRILDAQDSAQAQQDFITALSGISRCHMPSFSADSRRLAMICDINGIPQIWVTPAEGGWPTLAVASKNEVTSVYWSPTQDWLAYSEAPEGGLNEQTFIARPDGTQVQRVTTSDKADNWLDGWSADGKRLLIASNMGGSTGMNDYVVDPQAPTFQPSAYNTGTGDFLDVTADGKLALLYRLHDRGNEDLYLVRLADKKETLLTSHTGSGQFYGHITPDGRTVFARSDAGRDRLAFVRIKVSAAGEPGPMEVLESRDNAELWNVVINRSGDLVVLFWNVGGRAEIEFFHPQTGKFSAGPTLPTEEADAVEVSFSPDGKLLALNLYGSTQAPNIWTLNLTTMQLRQISLSNHPGVDTDELVRPELKQFKASDGLPLSGWLYLPKPGSKPFPLVISIHGGPETQELATFHSDYQSLLAQGIAVFAPNIRGSAGFGKAFMNLDNGALRVNAIRDVKDTADFLVSAGIADPKRLGIMGGSYGGYMTMAALSTYPRLFAAGVDMYGMVNFETFFKNTEGWMAAVSKTEFGDPDTQADLLRSLSPINHVDKIIAPTLILHGDHDTNVPVGEAKQMASALEKNRVPVQLVIFPGEGHGWNQTSTRIKSNLLVVQWFHKYLQH